MYKEGVYDVTDYMEEHPGGEDMILQAAGRSLEPFWAIYLGHEDNDEVIDILEALRIGITIPIYDFTRSYRLIHFR